MVEHKVKYCHSIPAGQCHSLRMTQVIRRDSTLSDGSLFFAIPLGVQATLLLVSILSTTPAMYCLAMSTPGLCVSFLSTVVAASLGHGIVVNDWVLIVGDWVLVSRMYLLSLRKWLVILGLLTSG